MESVKKIAVVLFNLGGPDCRESIRPFLYNFFTDRNILPLPLPLRKFVAARIAAKRGSGEAAKSYEALGGGSPLLENTRAQADALERSLSGIKGCEYRVFVSMRYWHPRAREVVKDVAAYAPDRIVLLPLYPQFSTTTTGSSAQEWQDEARRFGLDLPASLVCCYPLMDGFIEASARAVREGMREAEEKTGIKPRLLLSAHGLPEYVIKGGDPYQWQCEQTARAIAEKAGLAGEDWRICYQSRIGPMKWIGPSVEAALEDAAAAKKPVVLYPHAFVSEHVETLVELDIEYRELAEHLGIPAFVRVRTAGTDAAFIDGLAGLVRGAVSRTGEAGCAGSGSAAGETGAQICPRDKKRCCMNERGLMT